MSRKWLDALYEKIGNCWEWHSLALRIYFCYTKPEQRGDYWEIWAYPAVQEIVGGEDDGEWVSAGFNFNVMEFLVDFEAEAIGLSTRLPGHPNELTFEGKFGGKGVFLHVCLEPPEGAEPTEIIDLIGDGGPIARDKE